MCGVNVFGPGAGGVLLLGPSPMAANAANRAASVVVAEAGLGSLALAVVFVLAGAGGTVGVTSTLRVRRAVPEGAAGCT